MLCDNVPGLAGRQRRLCRMHPGVMVSLGEGAKMGIKECQDQFRDHRWNCSTLDRDASVFGKVMLKGKGYEMTRYRINTIEVEIYSLFPVAIQFQICTKDCLPTKVNSMNTYFHVIQSHLIF